MKSKADQARPRFNRLNEICFRDCEAPDDEYPSKFVLTFINSIFPSSPEAMGKSTKALSSLRFIHADKKLLITGKSKARKSHKISSISEISNNTNNFLMHWLLLLFLIIIN